MKIAAENVDKNADNSGRALGKSSSSGVRFLVRRTGSDIWTYHRNLAPDISKHVIGEVRLYWSGRTARLTGKRAIAISLGTSDHREAIRRRDQVHASVEILVDLATRHVRSIGMVPQPPRLLARLTEQQRRQLSEAVFSETLAEIDRPVVLGSSDNDDATLDAMVMEYVAEEAAEGTERQAVERLLERDFDRFLGRFNVEIVEETARREAALSIIRARRKAHKALRARDDGEVIEPEPVSYPFVPKLDDERKKEAEHLLRQTFEEFVIKKGMKIHTANDYRNQLNRFVDLFGDIPVGAVTRKMIFEYATELEKFPARYPDAWRGKNIRDIIKLAAKRPDLKRLAPQTINDRSVGALKSFFAWCIRRQIIDQNPATGVGLDVPKSREKPRLPYSISDLRKIFAHPVFTSGERPKRGGGEAMFWIPMIGLYTGMRLEEIGQLRLSDLMVQDGVSFFRITADGEETSLKTASSERRVPIHPDLIDRGLLEERDRRAKAGETRLFPALTKNREGKYTAMWSKYWGIWTRQIGIDDTRLVFHSFRHSFKDRCRDCKIPMAVSEALMGHSGKSVADNYGVGFSLSELADNMRKIDWSPVFSPALNETDPS